MTRLHADVVEVARRDDEPAQFLWRGRLYVVREILSRWTESGGWWRSAAVRAVSDIGTGDIGTGDIGTAATQSTSVDDDEQDWFRVEAAAGRSGSSSDGGAGVYDLCFSWSSGSWSLCRVLD